MPETGAVVVVGGTRAIGLEIVKHFAARGDEVVLSGQRAESVQAAVEQLADERVRGVTFDLADPHSIAPALRDVGPVRHLVLAAIDRDANSVRDYDIDRAIRLATLKLVGYTEVIHALVDPGYGRSFAIPPKSTRDDDSDSRSTRAWITSV